MAEKPTPETADLIRRGIKHVGDFLKWHNLMELSVSVTSKNAPGSPAEAGFLKSLEDQSGRKNQARADLLREGFQLAEILSDLGHDVKPLLLVLNAADAGGGPPAVGAVWPGAKAGLQEIMFQLNKAPTFSENIVLHMPELETPYVEYADNDEKDDQLTPEQCRVLRCLIESGDWMKGPKLKEYPDSQQRPDRIIGRMPPHLNILIEKDRVRGYKLTAKAKIVRH